MNILPHIDYHDYHDYNYYFFLGKSKPDSIQNVINISTK